MYSTKNSILVERTSDGFVFKVFVLDHENKEVEQDLRVEIYYDFEPDDFIIVKEQSIYALNKEYNTLRAGGNIWRHTEGCTLRVKEYI